MPFRGIQTKLRNDPLGPGYLSQLATNLAYLRNLAKVEHIAGTGEHNAWQVPRRVVTIDSGGTTITPSTSDVLSVSNLSTGRYLLTLAGGRFTDDIRVQCNIDDAAIIAKPCVIGYQVLNSTQIEIHTHQQQPPDFAHGGTTYSWTLINAQFSVALHSEPLGQGAYAADAVGHARGDTLTEVDTDWDATVQGHGDMQAMLTAAHTSAGAHNVYEVAKYWARIVTNPNTAQYEVQQGSSGVGVNRVSIGVVEVTYPSSTNQAVFICPDYGRVYGGGSSSDVLMMHAQRSSATKHTVYGYNASLGGGWAAADGDFFIVVHSS